MQIETLTLATPDLAAQRRFYAELLGLPLTATSATAFTVAVGRSALTFVQREASAVSCHHAFNIPPDQFAAASAWLAQRTPLLQDGAGTDRFWSQNWRAHMAYFADPDGNIGELIAREETAAAGDVAFGSASIRCISEFGLASTDVAATVRGLQVQTDGLPVYRGTLDPQFTPIGDADGLLIVVARGRPWYPEQRVAAGDVPFALTLRERGAVHTLTAELVGLGSVSLQEFTP